MSKYQEAKYQEALDVINQSDDEKFIKDCRAYFEKYKINPVAVIQELVDKETPMKPAQHIHSKTKEVYYECRGCGIAGITKAHNYCSECGQRLDWSDSE